MDTKRYGELTIRVEDVKFSVSFNRKGFAVYIHLGSDKVYYVEGSQFLYNKTRMEETAIFVMSEHARIYKNFKEHGRSKS